MRLSDFEKRYWASIDIKILLANLANQKELGLVSDADIEKFTDHLASPLTPSGSAIDILNSGSIAPDTYTLEDFFFRASIHPLAIDGQLLVRVAPLAAILASIDLGGREASLQKQLQAFSDTTADPSDNARAEHRLRTVFKNASFADFTGNWKDFLEEYCEYMLEAEFASDKGIGLSSSKVGTPKFVTYLTDQSGKEHQNLEAIKAGGTGPSGSGIADKLRDVLGLDHLTKTYKSHRTVLGFLVFRADDLTAHKIKRPTVFDETSTLRFRGACSLDAAALQEWGRTADLSKLHDAFEKGTTPSIVGCPEVVMDNPSLVRGTKVLVGYLGALELPRRDTNDLDPASEPDAYQKVQEIHELFLRQYLGANDASQVHSAIFSGISTK